MTVPSDRQMKMLAILRHNTNQTNSSLALQLGVSIHTIKKDKEKLYNLLGVSNQFDAMMVAIKEGLV